MKQFSKPIAILVIALGIVGFVAPTAIADSRGEISHIVVLWLKHPGNVEEENALIRATHSFRRIHGVRRIEVGRSIPIHRPEIEQAFDLCAIITFKDESALTKFENDKRHAQAVELFLKPFVRRYVIYNFAAD